MNTLLTNAAQSIRMGVEDYESDDAGRALSGVRNITAGVLLLFKEKLRLLSPSSSDEVLLRQKISPKIKNKNGLIFVGSGRKTVDVQQIQERFESLGISVDWKRVRTIVDLRNDIEHYYTGEAAGRLRELIADTFLIVRDFSTIHLNVPPLELLGEKTWNTLLMIGEVYTKELEDCQVDRAKVGWPSDIFRKLAEHVRCAQCGSALMKPIDIAQQDPPSIQFRCSSCGTTERFEELAESAVDDCLGSEAHLSIMDGGESPYEECPECSRSTFLVAESLCAACGYELEYAECPVCRNSLSLTEQELGGLCSYHHYVAERERDR